MSQPNSAESTPSQAVEKQQLNVYTVMLIIAFCCVTTACALLYFELQRWGSFPWWKTQSSATTSYVLPSDMTGPDAIGGSLQLAEQTGSSHTSPLA